MKKVIGYTFAECENEEYRLVYDKAVDILESLDNSSIYDVNQINFTLDNIEYTINMRLGEILLGKNDMFGKFEYIILRLGFVRYTYVIEVVTEINISGDIEEEERIFLENIPLPVLLEDFKKEINSYLDEQIELKKRITEEDKKTNVNFNRIEILDNIIYCNVRPIIMDKTYRENIKKVGKIETTKVDMEDLRNSRLV